MNKFLVIAILITGLSSVSAAIQHNPSPGQQPLSDHYNIYIYTNDVNLMK